MRKKENPFVTEKFKICPTKLECDVEPFWSDRWMLFPQENKDYIDTAKEYEESLLSIDFSLLDNYGLEVIGEDFEV